MKKSRSRSPTRTRKAELKVLAALPESEIDLNDIPEIRDWSGAKRGLFYRPMNKQQRQKRS
jgi:hypothetical protein